MKALITLHPAHPVYPLVDRCADALPPRDGAIVRGVVRDGRSVWKVAASRGEDPAAVRDRCRELLGALRRALVDADAADDTAKT